MTTSAPCAPVALRPRPPRPTLKTWVMAIRPKTLTAALVPVAVGTALAFGTGVGRWLPALAALVGALLIQIGTNLTNDYYDFKKGADTHERLGPMRVTQSGLIAPGTVLAAALGCFALAIARWACTWWRWAGWPIVAIGLASLLCGYAYTGGPFPLGVQRAGRRLRLRLLRARGGDGHLLRAGAHGEPGGVVGGGPGGRASARRSWW